MITSNELNKPMQVESIECLIKRHNEILREVRINGRVNEKQYSELYYIKSELKFRRGKDFVDSLDFI